MSKERLKSLLDSVRGIEQLFILPHNDPDPDAISAAVALRYLLEQEQGLESVIAYQGIVGRAENRALVRYLGHPLKPFDELDPGQILHVALVDTQPGAGNNPWASQYDIAIVMDHHPWRNASSKAQFADIRPDTGATSTIMFEYLRTAGLKLSGPLATALFYGIKTDTRGLSRGVSSADVDAYFSLQPRIEVEALADIERAQVPAAYFETFATSLETTKLYDGIAISFMGQMEYPDMAAEMADLLLRLEQVKWVICMGVYEELLILSVRAPGQHHDAGALIQAVVRKDGTAGGHDAMAGGQIPLAGQDVDQVVSELNRRILRHLKLSPDTVGQPLV